MFGVLGWFLVLVGLRISGTISLRLSLPNKAKLNAKADTHRMRDERGNSFSVKTNSCADVHKYGALRVKTLFKSHLILERDLRRQSNHASRADRQHSLLYFTPSQNMNEEIKSQSCHAM